MNNTPMRSGQDPDEYLYIMDSCRDCFNACDPPEGPTDRQYEDFILQSFPPEHKPLRQAHLERGSFGLADIRRMMAAVYADNLSRSRSDLFRSNAGRGAAMQAMVRDHTSSVTFVVVSATSKASAPYGSGTSSRMMDSSRSSVKDTRTTHADSTKETVEADEVPCGAHVLKQPPIGTPTAAPRGADELTAMLTLLPPVLRASRKSVAPTIFRKRGTSRNAPTSPSQRRRHIPRRQLQRGKATRRRSGRSVHCQHPWLFEERTKPVISLRGQESWTSTCIGNGRWGRTALRRGPNDARTGRDRAQTTR